MGVTKVTIMTTITSICSQAGGDYLEHTHTKKFIEHDRLISNKQYKLFSSSLSDATTGTESVSQFVFVTACDDAAKETDAVVAR
jgi:hypothetical protein